MKKKGFFGEIIKNKTLYAMMIPGLLLIITFCYMPMLGLTIAFKDGNTVSGYFSGQWVGMKNFEFFFKSQDAARITYNTLFTNTLLIGTKIIGAILCALLLNELRNKKMIKVYQSVTIVPTFLSWVIMGYVAFGFLSVDYGFINRTIGMFGGKPVDWYANPNYWPTIFVITNLIKNLGYETVIYYAAIVGIDETYYEAGKIDGITRWGAMRYITIPLIMPIISVMTLMAIGKIFYADFGLFYYIPRETGVLFPKTDVIDTYVYRALRVSGNTGMSAAVGLFQSVVGFILVLGSNLVARKINPENALF